MTPIATVTITAEVHLEHEPTLNTPDAYEPGYEYFAVREATVEKVDDFTVDDQIRRLAGNDTLDDIDPDDLIRSRLTEAIRSLSPEEDKEGDEGDDQ